MSQSMATLHRSLIPNHICIEFYADSWYEVPFDIEKITAPQLYLYLKLTGVTRIRDVPLYKCKKPELLAAFTDLFSESFTRFRTEPELEELELYLD